MTVIFVRLQLDLEEPDLNTVEQTHAALLAIQAAIYPRKGTLRQFLQVLVMLYSHFHARICRYMCRRI
jgi:hypothetical protein